MQKDPDEIFEDLKVEIVRLAKKAAFDLGVHAGIEGLQGKDKVAYRINWIAKIQNCTPQAAEVNHDSFIKAFEEGYKEGLGIIG